MSRRTTTTNGTANLRAAGLPEIEATAAATVAAATIGNMATQESRKKKPSIVNVSETENIYIIEYDTGSVKRVLKEKAPKTCLAWLEAHAAEVEAQNEPEALQETAAQVEQESETTSEMETAAADLEPNTETTMEPESIMETETIMEPVIMETAPETTRATETITEPVKPAETVKASTRTTETVREPDREPVSGIWLSPLQLALIIGIGILQFGIMAAWLSIQGILSVIQTAATIRQAVPVIIGTVQAGYMALRAQATTAAQSFTEATGAARRYWTEVLSDMRRDVPQVVRVSNKTLLRLGQTVLSTIR